MNKFYFFKQVSAFGKLFLVSACLFFTLSTTAQVSVTDSQTATALVQKLVGAGVAIMNPTLTCPGIANGIFSVTSSNLGLDSGIVLTNGAAETHLPSQTSPFTCGVNEPATMFASRDNNVAGDAQLTALAGQSTYDACILQFDFKPSGDTIKFSYVFGSEEYTSYTCSSFNDVFGFFISGGDYTTPVNIGLVPGTDIPVAINSVNGATPENNINIDICNAMGPGSPFNEYYIDNTVGTTITYNGFTTVLQAVATVNPCDTYHLKLGVADASDHIFDSGVFLEAGSLTSAATYVASSGLTNDAGAVPYCIRGCLPGKFIFSRTGTITMPLTIYYLIEGTAINGYDYEQIPDSIIIPAQIAADTLLITPLVVSSTPSKTIKLLILPPYSCNGANPIVDSATLIIYNPPFINGITINNPSCYGSCDGTITLHGLQPDQNVIVNYQKDGISQAPLNTHSATDSTVALTGLCAGTYDSIIATVNTCTSNYVDSITLAAPPPLEISNIVTTNPSACGVCDGAITLYGIPPNQPFIISYLFDGTSQSSIAVTSGADSSITLSNMCQGVYDSIVVHLGPCVAPPQSATLTPPPLIPNFTYAIHYGCRGDTVVFTNTSQFSTPVTYRWDFGDHIFDTAASPTHIYLYQDSFYVTLFIKSKFCIDSLTNTIALIHPIKAAFTISKDTLCQGQAVTFTNTSTGISPSYSWSFGDGTTDNTANALHTYNNSGIYQVLLTETDFVPCQDTSSLLLYVDSISAIYLTLSDSAICEGKEITFTGDYSDIGNTGITWDFGDGYIIKDVNPVSHSFDKSGTFAVTLTADYRACPDTSITKKFSVYTYPIVNIGRDTSFCPGQFQLILSNLTSNVQAIGYKNMWSTGDTTTSITVNTIGTYWLKVLTAEGCNNSDTMVISPDCYIEIPNAFTPNGDGVNDYFFPRQFLSDGLISFSMKIFDRWGQLIFETANTNGSGWDGKFNNVLQPEGVFIYIIDAAFIDGRTEHKQGAVTLLR